MNNSVNFMEMNLLYRMNENAEKRDCPEEIRTVVWDAYSPTCCCFGFHSVTDHFALWTNTIELTWRWKFDTQVVFIEHSHFAAAAFSGGSRSSSKRGRFFGRVNFKSDFQDIHYYAYFLSTLLRSIGVRILFSFCSFFYSPFILRNYNKKQDCLSRVVMAKRHRWKAAKIEW